MKPFFKRVLRGLFYDELKFIRWVRGTAFLFALGGWQLADQLERAGLDAPDLILSVRVASAVCAFAGGAITAGERNHR